MFEGSLVESRGFAVSRTQRWSAAGSAALQLMLATLVVMIPLLRPQTIKFFTQTPQLTAPPPPRPPVVVRVMPSNAPSAGPAVPAAPMVPSSGPRVFTTTPGTPTDDGRPGPIGPITMGPGAAPMPSFGVSNGGTAVTVERAASNGPINVSRGVSAGMLLSPIRPVYPAIARAARVEGTVVIEALISKAGQIESAHATSGPAMLQPAALDAVRAARYRPYLLSGKPVEVQTTVTVVFRLGE